MLLLPALALALATVATVAGHILPRDVASALSDAAADGTRVFVAINSDCETAERLGEAIYRTWYSSDVPGWQFVTARMIIGDSAVKGRKSACTGNPEVERTMATYLPWCPDAYPPVHKVLCMWRWMKETWDPTGEYTHYMKVDADTYVQLSNVLVIAQSMPPSKSLFAGMRGLGRGEERNRVPPFCMGAGYIVTRALVEELPRNLAGEDIVLPPNSDRAFSEVVLRTANVSCMAGVSPQFKWAFMNRYWDVDPSNGSVVEARMQLSTQMTLPLLHGLYSSWVKAATIHPFKTPVDMHRMHRAVQERRLPLFRLPFPAPEATISLLRPLCVHNPARQYELCGLETRECPTDVPSQKINLRRALHAHVLYLPGRKVSAERALNLSRVLTDMGLHVKRHAGTDGPAMFGQHLSVLDMPSLTAAEQGLRDSFARMFDSVLSGTGPFERSSRLHMFFEDDAILAPDFYNKLERLLTSNARCGQFLTVAPGGALLLGGTVWRNGTYPRVSRWTSGWWQADAEMARQTVPAAKQCYNLGNATSGAFGFIMDTQAVRLARAWLANTHYSSKPADHWWSFLADAGLPVRALSPPLVIPGLSDTVVHTSSLHTNVTFRSKLHRWTFA